MNRIKAVLQSKSANAPPQRGAHKKSWSSGEVTRLASKKRGVYVERLHPNSKTKEAANKQPPVVKRPPKNQKEFLNSVLTILSQETAGTQFPEQNAKEPTNVTHKRLRIRRRIPVNTADTGTQDLDAMYNDVSPTSDAPSPPAQHNKPARKKRFRSRARALNSNCLADLKLEEPEPITAVKKPSNPGENTSAKSITITKAVLDGQKIIDSKHNQGQSTPAESVAQPVNTFIEVELEKPEPPLAENPPGEKPKSKVRILEPLKAYEDEQFEGPVNTLEINSMHRNRRSTTNTRLSRSSFDDYYKSNLRKTRVQEHMPRGSYRRDFYQTVPVIEVDDYRDNESNVSGLDNVEVYTTVPTRMRNRPTAGFSRPYDNYARVCHMRSQSFNHKARKQFEVRQSKPTARTRVYTNQDKGRSAKYKNKGREHPLLELLKKELTLEPDWFVEPNNMHEALLKVMDGRKRARESIKFHEGSVGFKNFDQSECMLKGKQRRIVPARRQIYRPKAVGHAKRSDVHQHFRPKDDDTDSVIRIDFRAEEEFNLLYHPLDAPPSLTVQNYDYYREDTPLQSIYLSRKPEDVDSISSKDMVQRSAEQPQYINNLEGSVASSAFTSDTTLRLLMSPEALDYNMDK